MIRGTQVGGGGGGEGKQLNLLISYKLENTMRTKKYVVTCFNPSNPHDALKHRFSVGSYVTYNTFVQFVC